MKYDFIEIGTCDYHTLLEGCNTNQKGISVEPIKTYLDNLPNKLNVIKVNAAITSEDKTVDLFWVTPENQKKYNIPFTKGWGTIIHPHKGHGKNPEKLIMDGVLSKSQIEGITWKTLCNRYNISDVDLVKIDAEGHDCVIVNSILNYSNAFLPKKIIFEKTHCPKNELYDTINKLQKIGYTLIKDDEDMEWEKI